MENKADTNRQPETVDQAEEVAERSDTKIGSNLISGTLSQEAVDMRIKAEQAAMKGSGYGIKSILDK